MRRTQLYLEDDLWAALHAKALLEHSTISALVRQAVRDRYMGNLEQRKAAMLGVIGLWKNRTDLEDTDTIIRKLRRSRRLERIKPGSPSGK